MADILEKTILGATGLEVSRLCYGTLTLGPYQSRLTPEEGANLLRYAYSKGINFWDTAELYETYPHIRLALEQLNYPDDIIITSRSFHRTYHEMKSSIEQSLMALGLDTFKIFGLHELEGPEDFINAQGAFEALLEARQKGLIQHIAVTMHSVEALKLVSQLGYVDVVFPLYNYKGIGVKHGTVSELEQAIKNAYQKEKGVYAMKVLAGGHLSGEAEKAIQYVLNNPYIHSIALGMDNTDEIDMNLALFREQEGQVNFYKNKLKARYHKRVSVDPWCEGCGACMQICPNNAIFMEFSQAKIDHSKCLLCGYCASACKYFCLKVVNTL